MYLGSAQEGNPVLMKHFPASSIVLLEEWGTWWYLFLGKNDLFGVSILANQPSCIPEPCSCAEPLLSPTAAPGTSLGTES